MFNFRKKAWTDFVYEKVSRASSDDESSSEESEGFITPKPKTSTDSRRFKLLATTLVFSGLLNISLLGLLTYQYKSQKTQFPELVYCKLLLVAESEQEMC